tara:strand:- start:2367 stop:5711 length:3345 start_codon:yes stop_codon:yes gene_type:complete
MNKLIALLFSLFAPVAFAADTFANEFHVYGSFDSVVNGFTRIALIFNNSNYSALLYVFVFLAILVGTAVSLGKEMLGNGNAKQTFSMFVIPLFGATLFKVMMLPTSTMHLYDSTHNRYQTVGGVPSLIAYIAHGVNILERFATDTFSTSTTSRDKHANGATLKLYLDFSFNDPISDNHYLKTNINNFLEVCLPVGITSQSYTFDFDKFQTDTPDLLAYMANLKSTSNFMTYYSSTVKKGEIVDCTTGYNRISTTLVAPATFADHIASVCEQSGFDASTASSLALCKTRIDEISDLALDSSVNISVERLAASQAIANSLYGLMSDSKGSAIATIGDKRQMTEGMGNIIVAEGWLPIMRYNTMLIILAITPFFALMFLTPLLFKSLHTLVTMFIFIGIWGLIDSVMHDIIFDQVLDMLMELKAKGGGVQAMLMAPNELQKALAMFGKQQSLGVGLATLLTAIFFKFSGHAFANMGEKIGGHIDSIGDQSGHDTLDPHSNMNQMESYAGAGAKYNLRDNIGTEQFREAAGFNSQRQLNDADQYMKGMDSHNYTPTQARNMYSQKTAGDMVGSTHATQTRADISDKSLRDYSTERAELDTNKALSESEYTESLLPMVNGDQTPKSSQQIASSMDTLTGIERSDVKGKVIANEGSEHMATSVSTIQSLQKVGDAAAASKVARENEVTVDGLQQDITDTQLRGSIAASDAVEAIAKETNQSESDLQDRGALQSQMEQYANTVTTDNIKSNIGGSTLDTVKAQKGQSSVVLNDEQAKNLAENTNSQNVGEGVYSLAIDGDKDVVSTQARTGDSAHINNDYIDSSNYIDSDKRVIDNSQIEKSDNIKSAEQITSSKIVNDSSVMHNDGITDITGYDSQNMAFASKTSEGRVEVINDSLMQGQHANMISEMVESLQTKETLTDHEEVVNADNLDASVGIGGRFSMGDSSPSGKSSSSSSSSTPETKPKTLHDHMGMPRKEADTPSSKSSGKSGGKANIASMVMEAAGIQADIHAGLDYNKRMSDVETESSSISIDKYAQVLEQTRIAAMNEYDDDSFKVALAMNEVFEQIQEIDAQRLTREIDSDFNPLGELMESIGDNLPDSIKEIVDEFDDEPRRESVDLR